MPGRRRAYLHVSDIWRESEETTYVLLFLYHMTDGFDYAAPEIIDAQSYDEKSDIWSIGAVLLDICTTSIYNVIRLNKNNQFQHFDCLLFDKSRI
jgi:serine/threonine protein kinase